MRDDLDTALSRLARAPVPARLAALDVEPFDWLLNQPRDSGSGFQHGALAAAAAILIGVAGSTVPSGRLEARALLSPLGPTTPLTPSTLLGDVG
ncbi:MAG: hypothetical protein H0W71_04140 [Sphingomonas sp.]|nr:hypothetical protein [Sphingomonas sp.]